MVFAGAALAARHGVGSCICFDLLVNAGSNRKLSFALSFWPLRTEELFVCYLLFRIETLDCRFALPCMPEH